MSMFTRLRKQDIPVPAPLARAAGATVRWAVFCLAGFIFVCIATASFLSTSYFADTSLEIISFKTDTLWLNLLVLVAFAVFLAMLAHSGVQKVLTARRLQWILLVYAVAGGTLWVLASGSEAYAEPANISRYAVQLSVGDFSSLEYDGYFTMFPYQLGFTAYVQLVYALFGAGNDIALQLLNVLFTAGSFWFASSLCHRMFRDEAVTSLCCLLLYGCVYMLLLNTFTYGLVPGLFFAVLALWLTMKTLDGEGGRYLAFAGVAIALAVVMKINYLIFLAAILIAGMVYFLRKRRAVLLLSLAITAVMGFSVMQVVYLGYSLATGMPVAEGGVPYTVNVVMGLDMDNYYMAPGWYNGYTYSSYPDNGYDHEAAVVQADEMLAEKLEAIQAEKGRALHFFFEKTVSQWNEPTHQAVMLGYHAGREGWQRPGIVNDIYDGVLTFAGWLAEALMDKVHLLVYLGAALGLLLNRRRLGLNQLLCAMVVVGGILIHLVWEAKSQYIAPYFLLCVPYAALGWVSLYRTLHRAYGTIAKRGGGGT